MPKDSVYALGFEGAHENLSAGQRGRVGGRGVRGIRGGSLHGARHGHRRELVKGVGANPWPVAHLACKYVTVKELARGCLRNNREKHSQKKNRKRRYVADNHSFDNRHDAPTCRQNRDASGGRVRGDVSHLHKCCALDRRTISPKARKVASCACEDALIYLRAASTRRVKEGTDRLALGQLVVALHGAFRLQDLSLHAALVQ